MSTTATTEIDKNPLLGLSRAVTSSTKTNTAEDKKTILPSYTITMRHDEDGRIVVRCKNLQGVVTDGANDKEALDNAMEAINAILTAREMSKEYNINIIHI